jgi:hypothetical protein
VGYASRSGRASTSPRNPRAFGVCDRCAIWYNRDRLTWQYDWAGASLINKRILVCNTCYDEPQQQLRAIIIPADPVPITNPRTEPYAYDESNKRQVSGFNTVNQATGIPVQAGDTRVTSFNNIATEDPRVTQETGVANGSLNQLPGTDPNAITFRNVLNVTNNGIGVIRLTLNTTSGMTTGQQVTVQEIEGVTAANGNWIVTVINFSQVDLQNSNFSGAYTSGGYVINNPSLPIGFVEVPRTGPL